MAEICPCGSCADSTELRNNRLLLLLLPSSASHERTEHTRGVGEATSGWCLSQPERSVRNQRVCDADLRDDKLYVCMYVCMYACPSGRNVTCRAGETGAQPRRGNGQERTAQVSIIPSAKLILQPLCTPPLLGARRPSSSIAEGSSRCPALPAVARHHATTPDRSGTSTLGPQTRRHESSTSKDFSCGSSAV